MFNVHFLLWGWRYYKLFFSHKSTANLLITDLNKGFAVIFNTDSVYNSWESFTYYGTGKPPKYMWKDPKTFSVARYTVPMYFLGLKSFLITSIFTACFSYIGIWKFYRLYNTLLSWEFKSFCLFNFIFTNFSFLGWRYHER